MRNLKKHLSVLLVLAMVFTMMAPVFAVSSYNYEDEARALYELGLYKGVSDKNFVPDLGSALTREQEAILVLRLFGQEEEALKMSEAEVAEVLARFADADQISAWARNQVAYATSIGVIKGIESENGLIFNPQGALKGNDCASLLLQQLGVKDFEYFGALEKLASLGAITVAQMISFDKAQMIRDDVVGMSYGVLTAVAENGKTVIENLIDKGLSQREVAEKYNLVAKTTPVVEPTEEPVVEPTEQPVAKEATVEFIPAEAQSLALGQSLFEVGKVKVTAANEDVTVTGLKLQRTGLSADTDVTTATVWNGTEKVNSIGRFSNGVANIAFTKVVTVKAGQSLELPVKVNIVNNAARVGAQLRISLLEVKADATLTGTFPMEGNLFTLAPADLGRMNVKVSGDAPTANINAGDKDIRLAKFDIEFANEAQVLKQLILTQDGNAADTDLTNLRLIDEDGAVLATGALNKGEVAFTFTKEYASGTTARLTLRGDVVGGAGRTVQFSVNNVNDVQSVGKTYGTTIAGTIATGNLLTIERGALVLTKDASSPAAATIAETVDDQKVTSIKVEAIGEPVQLEDIALRATGTGLGNVTEVKLASNGVVIASQEFSTATGIGATTALALSEVLTVEPGKPVVIDVLMDAKNNTVAPITGQDYAFGFVGVSGTGLISGKSVSNADLTMGNKMTVGNVRVTLEQTAQVDGFVFLSQSEEKLAQFEISHNLGETVKLTSLEVTIEDQNPATALVPTTATKTVVENTFKNVKLASENGTVVSEVVVNPQSGVLNIALKEGVTVEAGKTLKLALVSDIKSATTVPTLSSQFKFYATDATAVTTATGTDVAIQASTDSRVVEISAPATKTTVDAKYSVDGDLENKNVLREDNNVKLAQWTVTNSNKEAVRINKVNLKATYGQVTPAIVVPATTASPASTIPVAGDLKPAYVNNYSLKDGNGNVLATFSSLPDGVAKEITLTKPMVIDPQEDGVDGENELIVTANIVKGAQYGGQISIALGNGTDLFEVTGVVSGETFMETGVTAPGSVEAGETGAALQNTVAISVIKPTAVSFEKSPKEGIAKQVVGAFRLNNTGKTAVNLTEVDLKVITDSSNTKTGGTYASALTQLALVDKDGVEIAKAPTPAATASLEGATVTFELATPIKISAGKYEQFEVRLTGTETLDAGESVRLKLEKAGTIYDDVNNTGYRIAIDDDLSLDAVVAQPK